VIGANVLLPQGAAVASGLMSAAYQGDLPQWWRCWASSSRQKRQEQTIASHSKDNAWQWKHGPEKTKPMMKEEEGGGGRGRVLFYSTKTFGKSGVDTRPHLQPFPARLPDEQHGMLS